MKHLFFVIVTVALFAGCRPNLTVVPTTPKPNVALSADSAPAALKLADSVKDEFSTTEEGGVMAVPVKGWRSTLTKGFESAFNPSGKEGRTLEILMADLSFAPAAVAANHNVVAVRAQIRFKARLLAADGTELGIVAGTAEARDANTSPSSETMTANAAQAVETMYEGLTSELIQKAGDGGGEAGGDDAEADSDEEETSDGE